MPNANKIIYSLRIYIALKEKGFEPIATSSKPQKPNFMCWIYDKTEEFEAALDEIMESKNEKF